MLTLKLAQKLITLGSAILQMALLQSRLAQQRGDTASKTTLSIFLLRPHGDGGDIAIGLTSKTNGWSFLVNGDLTITFWQNPLSTGETEACRCGQRLSLSRHRTELGKVSKTSASGGLGASAVSDAAVFNAYGGGGGASCVSSWHHRNVRTSGTAGVGGGTGLTCRQRLLH